MNKYGKYMVFYGFLISFQFMSGSTEFPIYAIGLQPILHMSGAYRRLVLLEA